ncbi:DUF4127 family protein [Clostridium sp.]|uniref:DUF4127 family protein n=1 Tax=Clostridium sp. TaxID=1506 RepID=UPI003D6C85D5
MKILYIPLDERPCNYKYPTQIALKINNIQLITPPQNILSKKKQAADIEKLWDFINRNAGSADYAILSLDMLIYGGLLPSRLHVEEIVMLLQRLERIVELKKMNPKLKIYAFGLIMRVPSYNSSEEEPDYYETYGETIFNISWLQDKINIGEANLEDSFKYSEYLEKLPKEYYEDYFNRREKNFMVTEEALKYVSQGIFEEFVIPQDDSALYGIQSKEQKDHIKTIEKLEIIDSVLIYPGADEVGCTLLSRILNYYNEKCPKVYVRFSSVIGPTIIPKYEDRPLLETIKAHIISCGMNITDNSTNADLILMVNSPENQMTEAFEQDDKPRTNQCYRNLKEFVASIIEYINSGKKVIISDSAYSNGSDVELITLLRSYNLLNKVTAYAGWNTNGNTLGTVLSSGVANLYGDVNLEFLIYRIVEDCGYQAIARQEVIKEIESKGLSYYDFKHQTSWVEDITKSMLNEFVEKFINSKFEGNAITVAKVKFPWDRMFEVDLNIEVK